MKRDEILDFFDSESYLICESCLQEKMAKLPFVGYGEKATKLLVLVHTEVCGPFDVQVRSGYSYFIIFVDDLSRYEYVYLMKHKSEAFERFKKFRHEVEKQKKNPLRFFDLIEEVNILVKNF